MRRAAIIKLSTTLLLESIGFPAGTEIVGARMDGFSKCLEICVEHPELPECIEGSVPKTLAPVFNCRPDTVPEFVSWGIE